MTKDELRAKANDLPLLPGVYLMMDKTGKVIYVGKAKKLKNRVSQYFQESASHTLKTRQMVSQVDHFDTIFVSSEFEALVLENSLIKRHMPHYNILLKDDKGYPFVRLSREPYPALRWPTAMPMTPPATSAPSAAGMRPDRLWMRCLPRCACPPVPVVSPGTSAPSGRASISTWAGATASAVRRCRRRNMTAGSNRHASCWRDGPSS